MPGRGKGLTFFVLPAMMSVVLLSSLVLPCFASSQASFSSSRNFASPLLASPLDEEECNATIHPTVVTIDALSYPSTIDLNSPAGTYGYVMPSVNADSCYGAAVEITISIPSTSAFGVSWNAADCPGGNGYWTEIIGGVTTYVYWCNVGAIEAGDYSTANFEIYYSGAESGPTCQTSGTLDLLAQGYVEGVPQPNPPSASMFVNVICRSTTTTTSTTSTTSSTTSTSTAGTAPCTTIDTNKDECTGTPTDGSLTASANIVSVTNVSITGTSATGSVTIDITDYAGNAWSYTGPDPRLGGGDGYYFVAVVTGATDGAAQVCITPSHGATTMDYYLPPSGPWTHAAPLSFPGDSICGVMPVSALSGTTIAVGVASTATAPCASTAPDEDECTGTPVGGNLTATSTDTGVNVSITGTSATGRVTINTTDYGGTPPSSGADLSLGSGAAYYDVVVTGATDGAAQVCITPSHGATTMDYYLPPSGPWTHAAPLSFPGDSICGVMPVSALSGTPVAVGTTSTTTTSSSTTTSTTTTSSTITSSSTTASTSTTAVAPGVPEFPLALGIGVALALALPALLLVKARLRKP